MHTARNPLPILSPDLPNEERMHVLKVLRDLRIQVSN